MSGVYDGERKNMPVLNNIEGWCATCKQPRIWNECSVCEGFGEVEDNTYTGPDDPDYPGYRDGSVACPACSGDGGEYRCPTCNSSGRSARVMAEASGEYR